MKASEAEKKILNESKLKGYVTPAYNGLCLSNIAHTVSKIFGLKTGIPVPNEFLDYKRLDGVKKVVLIIVDGLGYYHLLEEMKKNKGSAFNELKEEMIPITSVLPSTTTTALTSINTGLTPQEHGVMGYKMYLKEFGMLTNTLTFGPAMSSENFMDLGVNPSEFFKIDSIYKEWKSKGIKSSIMINIEYIDSPFSQILYQGAEITPCLSLADMFSEANKILNSKSSRKEFIQIYWDRIDRACHRHGVNTKHFSKELSKLDSPLKKFIKGMEGKDVVLMITADHGHINSSPKKTMFYHDSKIISDSLLTPPVTDWERMSYLYVKKDRENSVINHMKKKFPDKAFVIKSEDAVKQGFFGIGKPRKEALDRIGNLIILPKDEYTFSYPATLLDLFVKSIGVHGGVSKEEMVVPFICKRF